MTQLALHLLISVNKEYIKSCALLVFPVESNVCSWSFLICAKLGRFRAQVDVFLELGAACVSLLKVVFLSGRIVK